MRACDLAKCVFAALPKLATQHNNRFKFKHIQKVHSQKGSDVNTCANTHRDTCTQSSQLTQWFCALSQQSVPEAEHAVLRRSVPPLTSPGRLRPLPRWTAAEERCVQVSASGITTTFITLIVVVSEELQHHVVTSSESSSLDFYSGGTRLNDWMKAEKGVPASLCVLFLRSKEWVGGERRENWCGARGKERSADRWGNKNPAGIRVSLPFLHTGQFDFLFFVFPLVSWKSWKMAKIACRKNRKPSFSYYVFWGREAGRDMIIIQSPKCENHRLLVFLTPETFNLN